MSDSSPSRWRIGLALSTLWFVWGSTYLAVAWVLPVLPPFVMSAARFAIAAPLLAATAFASGAPRPTARQFAGAGLCGLFLFVGGNGGTVWAQTRIPSGLTAVLVGLVPIWLVALTAAIHRERPSTRSVAGLILGFFGVGGLVGGVGGHVDPLGAASVVAGTLAWAIGTLLTRHVRLPTSVMWSVAAQMAAGGAGLFIAATATGQLHEVHLDQVEARAGFAFLWLVFGGSIASLLAYNWLLRVVRPAVATTYAYINPLVAVWLGYWLNSEPITALQVACSAAVVGAVALITAR